MVDDKKNIALFSILLDNVWIVNALINKLDHMKMQTCYRQMEVLLTLLVRSRLIHNHK